MTWATSKPILVFLGLSVLKLGWMYATDRCQTDRRQTKASLNASALWRQRHNNRRSKMQLLDGQLQAATGAFSRHLWYSNEVRISLTNFDVNAEPQEKVQIVKNAGERIRTPNSSATLQL